jgi:hypothetical protein
MMVVGSGVSKAEMDEEGGEVQNSKGAAAAVAGREQQLATARMLASTYGLVEL